jgi:DNA-directed RNA polymerase subunit RPC12/RpoP
MEQLPSGTPLDPQAAPSMDQGQPAPRMNIDISARRPGEPLLYTGPHLCVTCAGENRTVSVYLKAGEMAPDCPKCGSRALWEP